MAPRQRFNPVDFYRKAALRKPLAVRAPRTRYRPATTPQLSTIGHLFDKAAGPLADYIKGERDRDDRANMQKALMAFRSGLPGQKERIDLSEQEIMDKYGRPAYDAVIGGPMDIDETDEDIDRRASDAWFNALPDIDDQGRFTQGKRLEGFDAAVAAAGDKPGPVTQEMLNTLLLSDMDREREKEAATLAHTRKMEYKAAPGSLRSEGYASRPAADIQYTQRMTELRDTLKRLEGENKQNTPEYRRIRTILSDLKTNIAKAPDVQFATAQAKKSGALAGEKNSKDYFQARDVIGNVKDIDDLTSRLQAVDGSALGFLAELKQQRDRVFALFGSKEALAKVEDVELVDALMGAEVFALIKVLGIGARGLDTPAERKFLRQVLTGSIELTKGTLLEMAAKRRRLQVRRVENWNERLKAGDYDNFYANNDYLKRPLPVPGPAPVHTSIDITGPVSGMTGPELGALFNSGKATPTQIEQIKTRLKALGFPVTK